MKKIICILLLILLISCQEQESIKIGAILSLTGNNAAHGERSMYGIELALEDISSNIEIIYEDSEFNAAKAVSAYHKLRNVDDVDIVLAFGSPIAMALAPMAEQDNVILMSLAAAPKYSEYGDYTFRISGSAVIEAEALVSVIDTYESSAILFMDNDYGAGTKDAILEKLNKDPLIIESFVSGARDFKTQLTKIKHKNPDIIFISSLGQVTGLVIKQARELGIETTIICSQACHNKDIITHAGSAAEGTLLTAPIDDQDSDFSKRYREKHDEPAWFGAMRFYDAVMVLDHTIQQCDELSSSCIKDELNKIENFPGASFDITFDENGDINDQFVLKTVKNSEFILK